MEVVVVPGEVITREAGHLRGHGTHHAGSETGGGQQHHTAHTPASGPLLASRSGRVDRVNRLLSVEPPKFPYTGEVGDIVVGRVTEVGSKRWKVDVGAIKQAVLHLSAVNLPGGAQRIRTYADALQMRSFIAEGDLISAEVQSVLSDGTLSLHTRSLKYGKLENGLAVQVPCHLIRKLKHHTVSLECGVDCILGNNGHVWITRRIPEEWRSDAGGDGEAPLAEALEQQYQRHAATAIEAPERRWISRVRSAVVLLKSMSAQIDPLSIMQVVGAMDKVGVDAPALSNPDTARRILTEAQLLV